jgi:hypothetical protein
LGSRPIEKKIDGIFNSAFFSPFVHVSGSAGCRASAACAVHMWTSWWMGVNGLPDEFAIVHQILHTSIAIKMTAPGHLTRGELRPLVAQYVMYESACRLDGRDSAASAALVDAARRRVVAAVRRAAAGTRRCDGEDEYIACDGDGGDVDGLDHTLRLRFGVRHAREGLFAAAGVTPPAYESEQWEYGGADSASSVASSAASSSSRSPASDRNSEAVGGLTAPDDIIAFLHLVDPAVVAEFEHCPKIITRLVTTWDEGTPDGVVVERTARLVAVLRTLFAAAASGDVLLALTEGVARYVRCLVESPSASAGAASAARAIVAFGAEMLEQLPSERWCLLTEEVDGERRAAQAALLIDALCSRLGLPSGATAPWHRAWGFHMHAARALRSISPQF